MDIEKIIEQEKTVAAYINEFVDTLVKTIETTPIEGVTVQSVSVNTFSVKLSTIRDNGLVMSAEYYSPVSQARLIRKALESCKTATDLYNKLQRLITEKAVILTNGGNISDTRYSLNICRIQTKNRHPLNKQTIKILEGALS